MRRWIAVCVLGLAVLAGCADQEPGGTNTMPTAPPSGAALPVTLERTGGIAGVHQILEVSADGGWVYTDQRRDATERGTLTEAQRAQLVALVSDPAFVQQLLDTGEGPGVCADGFQYSISVGPTTGSFEDCGGDDHRPAVEAVIAAVRDATPF